MAKENDNTLVNKIMEPIKILVNTAPSREKFLARNLNFSPSGGSSDDDLCDTLPAKPKSVRGSTEILMPEKRLRTKSTTDTLLPEAKRLKVDVIVAKAQISRLETKLNEQHIISSEMQILFEKENSSLLDQHKRDEKALADMKERLQIVLRKEKHLEEDHSEALKEIRNSKLQWDTQKAGLQKLIADLKDKLSEANMSSKGQLSKMKRDMEKLQQALESEQSEVKMLKQEITRLTDRAKQCTSLRTQLEKQTFELQQVTNKLKALEYERDSFRDWQQQTKTAENRLSNMAKLEKEVTRLKSSEKTLQDAVCNKLLLEEHVLSLTSRVENLQSIQQELHETNVKLSSLESSLEEWKNAARKHGVESVNALTSTLESSLHDQLIAAASSSEVQSQKAQLTEVITFFVYY